ncbi:MAG: PucR family transcriptional regulator ligand-binding domain-containing protein [Microbacterium sp.]
MKEYLDIADLLAMPHLGLQLAAGEAGAGNTVLWTHTSELEDPGPWLEGGELLIVNGFGIPDDAAGQVDYVNRLAQHRLAGIAVSVKAPELTEEMLREANRLEFPVLRIPRQVPFIELSHLVANASERSARGRLSRHLRIFETLRLRNSLESSPVDIYPQLEQESGYRLALVSPAGYPLLPEWPWVPPGLELAQSPLLTDLQVIPGGYLLPLLVGKRVTAYLVGIETPGLRPGGLAALQHVSALASLDAIDDQRRREALHREGSALLSRALDGENENGDLLQEFARAGLPIEHHPRLIALEAVPGQMLEEIEVRDWLADRSSPHLLVRQSALHAVVNCSDDDVRALAESVNANIGVSSRIRRLSELTQRRRQALWALNVARETPGAHVTFAELQSGLEQWLNPDAERMRQLVSETLRPLVEHDAERGTELLKTLGVYFQHHGRLRAAAAQLFVHEHTLTYRLKQVEKLTDRDLKNYRDVFELWLAIESSNRTG